jgi:hypothetical protein
MGVQVTTEGLHHNCRKSASAGSRRLTMLHSRDKQQIVRMLRHWEVVNALCCTAEQWSQRLARTDIHNSSAWGPHLGRHISTFGEHLAKHTGIWCHRHTDIGSLSTFSSSLIMFV